MPRAIHNLPMSRASMVGLWWYYGTEAKAARALGTSQAEFNRALSRQEFSAQFTIKVQQWFIDATPEQRHAARYGGEMVRSFSREQAELLKREGFQGRRFSNAVKRWTLRRDRIPRSVGDFIEEAYISGAQPVD